MVVEWITSMERWWNDTDKRTTTGRNTYPSATLPNTNLKWTHRDRTGASLVRGRRRGRNGWITLRWILVKSILLAKLDRTRLWSCPTLDPAKWCSKYRYYQTQLDSISAQPAETEYGFSSTLSLTSALDAGWWSTPPRCHFTPGKESRYPLYESGWAGLYGWGKSRPHRDSIPEPSSP